MTVRAAAITVALGILTSGFPLAPIDVALTAAAASGIDPRAIVAQGSPVFSEDFSTDPRKDGRWRVVLYDSNPANQGEWDPGAKAFYLTRPAEARASVAIPSVRLTSDEWAASFKFKMGGGRANADGMAFHFYKNVDVYGPACPPEGGGFLGFACRGDLPIPGYGIELDTFFNWEWDPTSTHVALVEDHVRHHLAYSHRDLADSAFHTALVVYRHGEVTVFIDNVEVLHHRIPNPSYAFNGIAFSAGTGWGYQDHVIDDFVLYEMGRSVAVAGAKLVPGANPLVARPGQFTRGTLSLSNPGGVARTFTMDASLPGPEWTFSLKGATVTVPPGSVQTFAFTLAAPATAVWNAQYSARLRATASDLSLEATQLVRTRPAHQPTMAASWNPDTSAFDLSARLVDLRTGRVATTSEITGDGYTMRASLETTSSSQVLASTAMSTDSLDSRSFVASLKPPAGHVLGGAKYVVKVIARALNGGDEVETEMVLSPFATGNGYVSGRVYDLDGFFWSGRATVAIHRLDSYGKSAGGPIDSVELRDGASSFRLRSVPWSGKGPSCERCIVVVTDPAGALLGSASVAVSRNRDATVDVIAGQGLSALAARLRAAAAATVTSIHRDTDAYAKIAGDTVHVLKTQGWLDKAFLVADLVKYGLVARNTGAKLLKPSSAVEGAATGDSVDARNRALEAMDGLASVSGGNAAEARRSGRELLNALWSGDAPGISQRADAEIDRVAEGAGRNAGEVAGLTLRNPPASGASLRNTLLLHADDPSSPYYRNPYALAKRQVDLDHARIEGADWSRAASPDFDSATWSVALGELERAARGETQRITVSGYRAVDSDGATKTYPPFTAQLPLPEVAKRFDEAKGKIAAGAAGRTFATGASIGIHALVLLGVIAPPAWIAVAIGGALFVTGVVSTSEYTNGLQQLAVASAQGADAWTETMVGKAAAYHALSESLKTESAQPRLYHERILYGGEVLHGGQPASGSYFIRRSDLASPGVAGDAFTVTLVNRAKLADVPTDADFTIRVDATARSLVQDKTTYTIPCATMSGGTYAGCRAGTSKSYTVGACSETRPTRASVAPPISLAAHLKPGEAREIKIPFVAFWDGRSCEEQRGGIPPVRLVQRHTTLDYTIEVYAGPHLVKRFALEVRGGPGSTSGSAAVANGPMTSAVVEDLLTLSPDEPLVLRDVTLPGDLARASFTLAAPPSVEVAITVEDAAGRALGYDPASGDVARGIFGEVYESSGEVLGVDLLYPSSGDYRVTARLLHGPGGAVDVRLVRDDVPLDAASLSVSPGSARLALNATHAEGDLAIEVAEGTGLLPLLDVRARATTPRFGGGVHLALASSAEVALGDLAGGEETTVTFRVAGCLQEPCFLPSGEYAGTIEVTGRTLSGETLSQSIPYVVVVDFHPPVTSPGVGSGPRHVSGSDLYVGPATLLALSATDDRSGVSLTYGGEEGATTLVTRPFSLGGPSRSTALVGWSVDGAGNVEAPKRLPLLFDADAPTSDLAIAGPLAGGHVTSATVFTLTGADPEVNGIASGLSGIPCRISGPTLAPYESPDCSQPFTLVGDDGPYVLAYWAVDRVGNEEPARALRVVLDNTLPTVEILAPAPGSVSEGVQGTTVRRDSDGDGFADVVERALGTDPRVALSTPRSAQVLADAGFDGGLAAWDTEGSDALTRVVPVPENSPWRAAGAPSLAGALSPALVAEATAALAPALDALAVGGAGADDAVSTASRQVAGLLAGAAPDPAEEAALAAHVADAIRAFAARHPPPSDPGEPPRRAEALAQSIAAGAAVGLGVAEPALAPESSALEIRGVAGTARLAQRLDGGAPWRGFHGVAFDAIVDEDALGIDVVVDATTPESGRALRFVATVPESALREDAWQRIELPASAFRPVVPLVAASAMETATLASLTVAVRMDASRETLSPDGPSFDLGHARLDNVRLYATARDALTVGQVEDAIEGAFRQAEVLARSDPRLQPLVDLLDQVGRREGVPIAARVLLSNAPGTLPALLERYVEENLTAALAAANGIAQTANAVAKPHVERAQRTAESTERTARDRAAPVSAYVDSVTAYVNSVLLPYLEEAAGPALREAQDRAGAIQPRVAPDATAPPPATLVVGPRLLVTARALDPVLNGAAAGIATLEVEIDGLVIPSVPTREGDLVGWSADVSGVSVGGHLLRVRVSDAVGNAATAELPVTLVAATAGAAEATVDAIVNRCRVACVE